MRVDRIVGLLVFPLVLALAGCATSYHADNYQGGYSESQLDRNVFRVTYKGNATTKQSETDELALLRGAEIAQQHGFAFFVSGGNAATGTAMSLATNVVSVPATTITIYCYATRPESSAIVYDADQLVTTLGPKYHKL